ncbi:hypothetical protein L1887_28604 [Cichorium endivia]|nr:hypothetical protein L1887_28604 [Cichorium endivia]
MPAITATGNLFFLEDLARMSGAGLYDSIPNVKDLAGICASYTVVNSVGGGCSSLTVMRMGYASPIVTICGSASILDYSSLLADVPASIDSD